jgi:hypothetical protein
VEITTKTSLHAAEALAVSEVLQVPKGIKVRKVHKELKV